MCSKYNIFYTYKINYTYIKHIHCFWRIKLIHSRKLILKSLLSDFSSLDTNNLIRARLSLLFPILLFFPNLYSRIPPAISNHFLAKFKLRRARRRLILVAAMPQFLSNLKFKGRLQAKI